MDKIKRFLNFPSTTKSSNSSDETTIKHLDKPWLDLSFHDSKKEFVKRPHELIGEMKSPPKLKEEKILDRIRGSILGLAIGDALGAPVEFRPREYLLEYAVNDFQGGGTWDLKVGQFTDDTSMALCLASSLIVKGGFSLYDQLVRYKWWFRNGFMSSTGKCFDIGAATRQSLCEFEYRQKLFANKYEKTMEEMDFLSSSKLRDKFNVYCSTSDVAGNGALMRLAPVPLFFRRDPFYAIKYSGESGRITHGDRKAADACRYFGALIVAALKGYSKEEILDDKFYAKHKSWFDDEKLCTEIFKIANGSYKREGGYDEGIRGKGYVVNSLEAALWAFWSTSSFRAGALAAVNLGDDTDTTAAIYGQLAGAFYGYEKLPCDWLQKLYAKRFLVNISEWIFYEGNEWQPGKKLKQNNPKSTKLNPSRDVEMYRSGPNLFNPQEKDDLSGGARQFLSIRKTVSLSSSEHSQPDIGRAPLKKYSDYEDIALSPNTELAYRQARAHSGDALGRTQISSRAQIYFHHSAHDQNTSRSISSPTHSPTQRYDRMSRLNNLPNRNGDASILNSADKDPRREYSIAKPQPRDAQVTAMNFDPIQMHQKRSQFPNVTILPTYHYRDNRF